MSKFISGGEPKKIHIFTKNLQRLMLDREVTIYEMAKFLGISSAAFSSIKNRRKPVDRMTLESIADYLDLDDSDSVDLIAQGLEALSNE